MHACNLQTCYIFCHVQFRMKACVYISPAVRGAYICCVLNHTNLDCLVTTQYDMCSKCQLVWMVWLRIKPNSLCVAACYGEAVEVRALLSDGACVDGRNS